MVLLQLKAKDCAPIMKKVDFNGRSFYSWPCPVGACLSPEYRKKFDLFNAAAEKWVIPSIRDLVEGKHLIVDDILWFSMLQGAYDTKNLYMYHYLLETI